MISTRGRYALRVIVDLALHNNGGFTPIKEVAERQEISLKYIERIMPLLSRGGLVEGIHGKGGGYRLKKDSHDITVGDILRLTEGELAPVACLAKDAEPCTRASSCATLGVWSGYYKLTREYLDGITIASLVSTPDVGEYVI